MKRNLLLFLAVLISIVLVVNSSKRILNLRTTSQQVKESEAQLENLKKENEKLQAELKYKKSNEFAEKEIRDKLSLAKEGETVVILPKEEKSQNSELRTWNLTGRSGGISFLAVSLIKKTRALVPSPFSCSGGGSRTHFWRL